MGNEEKEEYIPVTREQYDASIKKTIAEVRTWPYWEQVHMGRCLPEHFVGKPEAV